MLKGPIGVFDSGYGGLTVLKEFIKACPENDFIYLGDNARSPYGVRSFDTIFEYTLEAVQYLISRECPLIILACNTASAKALKNIQKLYLPEIDPSLRVLGVIRPTAEAIGDVTQSNHVGILATKGTVSSLSYVLEINKLFPNVQVFQQACPMWVPIVENNEVDSEGARFFIKRDLDSLLNQHPEIDTILLGCTHYPVLYPLIRSLLPDNIHIITQGNIVAKSLVDYLKRHPEIDICCNRHADIEYVTTGPNDEFDTYTSEFMGGDVHSTRVDLHKLSKVSYEKI